MRELQLPLCPLPRRGKTRKTNFSLSDFRALLTGKVSRQYFNLTNLWLDMRRMMFLTKQGLLCTLPAVFVWQIWGGDVVVKVSLNELFCREWDYIGLISISERKVDRKMLKVSTCLRISSVYIFLCSRLCSRLCVRLCLLRLCGFFSVLFQVASIEILPNKTLVPTHMLHMAWSAGLFGVLFGHREKNNTVLVHTHDPWVLPFHWVFRKWTYTFRTFSSLSWAVSAVMRGRAAQNRGKSFTHICLAQEEHLQRKLKKLAISFRKTALGFGYWTLSSSFWKAQFPKCAAERAVLICCASLVSHSHNLLILMSKEWSSAQKQHSPL